MFNKITSRENQKLKNARKTREGKSKDEIFIEGLRLAEEAEKSGLQINECLIDERFGKSAREGELLEKIEQKCKSINTVENKIFQSLADTQHAQGIILLAKKPANVLKEQGNIERNKHFLLLFEVNNPSNLGAILRTAEAAGIGGVIVSKNSTDAFSPKSLRASMGAAFRLPVWENAAFEEVMRWAQERNLITTAADINAQKSYTKIDWTKPRLITFGSEAEGLSEKKRGEMDELMIIPMENSVESLNLAVSCGIILFEAKRHLEK